MHLLISSDETAGQKCSSIPCPGPEGFRGRRDGACSGCCVVGLAEGAHVDWFWGKAQADVGCCMAALCPGQCHGCGFMEGN